MGLNAKSAPGKGGKFKRELLEAGTYPARLVGVADLGLQYRRPYQGKEKEPINELMLTYEFSDEFIKGADGEEQSDKPRFLSEIIPFHNLGAEKAKSTQRYKALDPDVALDGDWSRLLGTPCSVTLILNTYKKDGVEKTVEKIVGISAMRKKDAEKLPELVNTPKFFNLDVPDLDVFNSFPDWIKEKIKGNLNYKGSSLEAAVGSTSAPKEEAPPAEGQGDADNRPF